METIKITITKESGFYKILKESLKRKEEIRKIMASPEWKEKMREHKLLYANWKSEQA